MNDDPFRSEYATSIQYVADSLRLARSAPEPDRIEIIRRYEYLAIMVQSAASRLMASCDPSSESASLGDFENNMTLYEEMNVHDLLSEGWGVQYYSPTGSIDFMDERLFASLIQVVLATTIAMEGYDLHKRALEALHFHATREPGSALAERWSRKFSWMIEIMGQDSSSDES